METYPVRGGRRWAYCLLLLVVWATSIHGEPPLPHGLDIGRSGSPASGKHGEYFLAEAAQESESPFPLRASFDDGVALTTLDDEFELRIHLMEQTDFKLFVPTFQEPARSGVYIPRFRTYFEGHITRSFEYELSLQRSVEGTFDILDANINFRPSEAFQIKLGRTVVPYSYEWYDHLEQYFIAPERGLFPLNFGLSREAGAMVWGVLNDGGVQYAVGGFSGQLAGLADTNNTRDGVGYLNVRPFRHSDAVPALRNLNIGGSIALGLTAYSADPLPMRTSIQSSENDEAAQAASAVFLEFEDDVMVRGSRRQGAVHSALYLGGLSFESEAHVARFAFRGPKGRAELPVWGVSATTGYFITGEEVEGRTLVIPRRPFNPASGQYGPGAIELIVRYSYLHLGETVFDAGLADPEKWSNEATIIDLGWNWYPNRYIKFYCDWQHAIYGSPVLVDEEDNRFRRRNDLFWVRAQVFF